MNRKTLGLARTLAGLCAAVVANAYAGIYYEATTIAKADATSGENKTSVTVWNDGSSTKIEFKDGQQMGMFGPGSYLLTKDGGQTLYLVNPEDKTYSAFDLGGMLNAADKAMASMGGMVKMEVTSPHFEKLSESAGGNILGHATQHVVFKSGYTMSLTVMGKKMDSVVEMNQELWMAPDIDPAAFNAWLRPDKMMTGAFKGMGDLMSAQLNQLQGAPLKSVVETTSSGGMGGTSKRTMTTEVTVLRQESIPAATFALPADYKETQLIDELSNEGQGKAASAGQQTTPGVEQGITTLKGLFGK
jgi:hypothetical protein